MADINILFKDDQYRDIVKDTLLKTPYMPDNLCIHGFKVAVKKKTLKRRTQV